MSKKSLLSLPLLDPLALSDRILPETDREAITYNRLEWRIAVSMLPFSCIWFSIQFFLYFGSSLFLLFFRFSLFN